MIGALSLLSTHRQIANLRFQGSFAVSNSSELLGGLRLDRMKTALEHLFNNCNPGSEVVLRKGVLTLLG